MSSLALDLHHRFEDVLPNVQKVSSSKKTLNARHMQTATRLLLKGELEKHAIMEGTKAAHAFTNKELRQEEIDRARPTLKPARVMRILRKDRAAARISPSASWYLAGVLNYVVGEVAELSLSQIADKKKGNIIKPRNVYLAINGDEELQPLFRGTIAGGGVMQSQKIDDEKKKVSKK